MDCVLPSLPVCVNHSFPTNPNPNSIHLLFFLCKSSMAIASPSFSPSASASFSASSSSSSSRSDSPSFARFPRPHRRILASSRLNSSTFSAPGDNGDVHYELQHGFSLDRRKRGAAVFVTLPIDAVSTAGEVRRRRAMSQSFRALAAAGVEGVVIEVWWGLVERDAPCTYNWLGYLEIVALARRFGLKVRAVLSFNQNGLGPDDPHWIPLPKWVLEEINKDPDLAYSDRFGRKSTEYITLGCDTFPVLRGRSPIQAYADFMRNFRDTFRPYLGAIVTGIQVGMGPAGELRYPSSPSQKLTWAWRSRELGEFQCYDKYMLASLNACAQNIGMREWGNGGPIGASNLMNNPEQTEFFNGEDGSWNTPYGEFFLKWYSEMLLLHGERLCKEAETIFRGIEVNLSAKLAGIHWHYGTKSHPSELTAGYYNTSVRDGYLPIARMFGQYRFTICCSCFEMKDVAEKQMNPVSSPEGFLRQLLMAARICDIPLEGENSALGLDDDSFQQVVTMSRVYTDGLEKPSFSFNFVRMDKNMFEYGNWVRFTRFVRQMSDSSKFFRAKLDPGSNRGHSSVSDITTSRLALVYH